MNLSETAAILTAAGRSVRMGTPKALLDWAGKPLIAHQVAALAGCAQVLVVLGHEALAVRPFVPTGPRVTVLDNPDFEAGRASSIALACRFLASSPAPRGVLLVAVDQPLPPALPRFLMDRVAGDSLAVQPVFEGRCGHPVWIHRSLLPELLRLEAHPEGLRSLLQQHRDHLQEVPVPFPEVLLNLNHPEDYEAARAACL
ncbi:MAG: nucleotidyltransferase family protein [Candidatus Sericytochromatia bacterium]|nr:nucleotidyltransferase family protein [Candidatus Sericytochromatia bacterium]